MATDSALMQHPQRRVRAWAAVALVLAVLLAGYCLYLGVRYGLAAREALSLSGEIQQKSGVSLVLPDLENLDSDLVAADRRLAEQRAWYSQPPDQDLMARLSGLAAESRVELLSVTGVDAQDETSGGVAYRVLPVTVSLRADDVEDIYRLISRLGEEPPVAAVSSISMSDVDEAATAQVRFLFYFLPEDAPEGEEAGN